MDKIPEEVKEALRYFEIREEIAIALDSYHLEVMIAKLVHNGDNSTAGIKNADVIMKWKEGGRDEQKR